MAKRHDEGKVVEMLARKGRVRVDKKVKILHVSRGADIGIKLWGKIDFLTHYCWWTLILY